LGLRLFHRFVAAVALAGLLGAGGAARAQDAWYESFEGPTPSWRQAESNAQFQIDFHDRLRDEAHTGERCERVVLHAGGGSFIYLAHDVGSPLVIDELLPTVWIKADRPGLEFLVQVALPRSPDPRTGRSLTALIPGTRYTTVGKWQQLRVEDIPRQVARQVRALRMQYGPTVDEREAYVEAVLLNVYGGPGVTTVYIDDLDVRGHVPRPSNASSAAANSAPAGDVLGSGRPGLVSNVAIASPVVPTLPALAVEHARVEFNDTVLVVDGRPFFPRMIQYRGEPLEFLQRLGFNTIWLDEVPPPSLLAEADRLNLWVVCPPPRPEGLELPYGPLRAMGEIGTEFERVLAWNLGRGLSTEHLEVTKRWVEQVRGASRRRSRPLVGQPDAELRIYSRHLDLLMVGYRPMGSSLELRDYGSWLARRPGLARPGTPIWNTVQTQLAPSVAEQLRAIDPSRPPPLTLPSEQIRLLAYVAVATGTRGLLFESYTPLNAGDPDTQQRALALELVNLELRLLETWAAAGSVAGTSGSSVAEVSGAVLRTDRARLVLPVWLGQGGQFTAGPSAANNLSLVMPGVPESCTAYELLPGGLRPLHHKRAAGGMQVTIDEFGVADQVLLAHDPLIMSVVSKQAEAAGPRGAQLARALANPKLATIQRVLGELSRYGVPPPLTRQWLATAQLALQTADGQLALQQYQLAYIAAHRSMAAMRLIERTAWDLGMKHLASPMTSPGAISFATLPWYFRLQERIDGAALGPNRLPGGDFEDLAATLGANWQHFQHRIEGVQTIAELVPGAAHTGHSGMRLAAWPENPLAAPALLETPPVWIVSPPVPVEAGEVVCIRGWVRIRAALTASFDGLLIFDSFSGEPLAERIGRAVGWRDFVLYRVAPRSGPLTVTFALTGLGEVSLDDVTVQVLGPPRAAGIVQGPPPGMMPR
jgi:hypothetical protein